MTGGTPRGRAEVRTAPSSAEAPTTPSAVPGPADVVVVGAGAVGLCCALYLQRAGFRVAIVDRASPGAGASGSNAGILSLGNVIPTATPGILASVPHMLVDPLSPLAIRWTYLPRVAPWLVRFALASRRARAEACSRALASLVVHASEAYEPFAPEGPFGFRSTGGVLCGYQTDRAFARETYANELRQRGGIRFRLVDQAAIAELDSGLAGRFRHGTLIEGRLTDDPRRFCEALAERFLTSGGELCQAEVTDLEVSARGVETLLTTAGPLAANAFVLAAGVWSGRLARKLGVAVPLDTERGYGVDLPEPNVTFRLPILSGEHHFALVPHADGSMRLAGTDELAGLGAPPNYARADRLIAAARTVFPELRTTGARRWIGFRPSMPDALPVIGPVPRVPNAYLAFGHGHLGLSLAGITGRLVGELVEGRAPSVDLTPFSPTRFSLLPWRRGPSRRAASSEVADQMKG